MAGEVIPSKAMNGRAAFVSPRDSESLLAAIAARTVDANAGIFGPYSASWPINRESALFLGAGRAALLQLAHPWVTASLDQHSTLMHSPIARFHHTFRIVFTMVFGSLDQALAAARYLYALHARIRGQMTEDVARWRCGSHYEANEISALRWVFATLVESAVLSHDCALGPLTVAEREQYYAESITLAGLFGLPEAALPANWEAFAAYNREMCSSDALGVSDTARRMAHRLLAGAGSWIRPPFWYRALTAEWIPERFRHEFGLDSGAPQHRAAAQRAAEHAKQRLPRIYRKLPPAIRFIGPWHEARARLAGTRVSTVTRWSNRFWIGQPLLPFAAGTALRCDQEGATIAK